ncbi:hypothetical protein A8709_03000 [Paenibacillus pectinilyticus]|uniref:HTH tetR-type domain-containing protein n=1 Tax=Paenibacillus pectinilyticus TaxID=512399 RepID=A0A1C1A768_9BACL|nr:TetR/AcrR family transcriptional regulator [Paenibacillus pectinilyticus]OCT16412.1 hypothetical protein A8709_03000 [Paenibacillus pectinilyticus]
MTDKRVIRSKKVFNDTLVTLLKKKDFSKITVSEIIRTSDLNRSTFYQHYNSKEDLLKEAMENEVEGIKQALYEPFQNSNSVVLEADRLSLIRVFEYIYQNKKFFSTVLSSSLAIDFLKKIHEELIYHGHHNLTYSFNPASTVNVDLYIQYGMSALIGLIANWIGNDFPYTPEELSKELSKIIVTAPEAVSFLSKEK